LPISVQTYYPFFAALHFDLFRICPFSELLGFYSGVYQNTYQVSILGVSPVWMGNNEDQKQDLARLLKKGNIFAFGMSEKKPGANLYSIIKASLQEFTLRATCKEPVPSVLWSIGL